MPPVYMDTVANLKDQALQIMKSGGFPITQEISITVDETLSFMGYTTEKKGKPNIVISGWSLTSGKVMGLLVHELSHVYRIQTNHPSHNGRLHNAVLAKLFGNKQLSAYQEEIIRAAINNIQDVYADDISFAVYFSETEKQDMNEFFRGWIHEPIRQPHTPKDQWTNAGNLLNAAFSQANLQRHHVADTDQKVEKAITQFLAKNDKKLVNKYAYFKEMLVHFPEEITDRDFETALHGYLSTFLGLTK